mgnify:CR=1 FL=1
MTIGEFVALHRKKSGFTSQRKLADESGISSATISRIEKNLQKPSPDTLRTLALSLGSTSYRELMIQSGYGYNDYNQTLSEDRETSGEIETSNETNSGQRDADKEGNTPKFTVVQRIEIVSEITEEDLKKVDLNEYEQEIYEQLREDTDDEAVITVEVTVKK